MSTIEQQGELAKYLLTSHYVNFHHEVEPEDVSIEGNVLASGDDKEDAEAEQWVRDQLEAGNTYAWASIRVVAEFMGLEADDHLGCCSYESEEAFRRDGYEEMKLEACYGLAGKILAVLECNEQLQKQLAA